MRGRASILWTRLDGPGHEVAELAAAAAGWRLSGVALLEHGGRPCRMEYRVDCDALWRTRRLRLRGLVGGALVAIDLARGVRGGWRSRATPVPALAGCADVDLGFTPATNLLSIRRLGLAVGERAAVRAAWVRFPEITVEVLDQHYTRLAGDRYLYESDGGAFRRELTVSADGFVLEYPGLWRAECTSSHPRRNA